MKKVWIFGCSFSSEYKYIKFEDTYGNLLAKELGYDVKNKSKAANSNDKILYDLTMNLKNINEGDIILFQFSFFSRIGFFIDDKEENYFSTITLPEYIDIFY